MSKNSTIRTGCSALDTPIHVTNFKDRRATSMSSETISLRDLGDRIRYFAARSKESMHHIKLARFSGQRSDRGSFRHNAAMRKISGVECDYDAGVMTVQEAAAALEKAQVAGLIYTTPSHMKDGNGSRWRLLVPLSAEVEPWERAQLVARLNGVLGGVLSGESFTMSQSFGFGTVVGEKEAEVCWVEGQFVDHCYDLDEIAIGKHVRERGGAVPATDMSDDPWKVDAAAKILERAAERLSDTFEERNAALCREAFLAGGLMANCLVTREQVIEELLPSTMLNGYLYDHAAGDEAEVERIIDASLTAGAREPFDPIGDALEFDDYDADDADEADNTPSISEMLNMDPEPENLQPSSAEFLESAAMLDGLEIPDREWLVRELVPHRTVTILGGDGGTGKSLLALQLAVATTTCSDWITCSVDRPGAVIYISAEDEKDELHRRFVSVCSATGITLSDLSGLLFRSLAGESAILSELDRRSGKMRPTKLFKELSNAVAEEKPSLVVLDTLADLHSGDQNDQSHARQFITQLRGLCIRHGCTVLLLAHPSLTGITSGTGTGGSMAWNNSVRSRLYLRRIKDGGSEGDPDARILETMKSNYGRVGGEIRLRWKCGAFDAVSAEDQNELQFKAEAIFLKVLDLMGSQGRRLSHKPGPNYAPKLISDHPAAVGVTKRMLQVAMEEMLNDDRLKIVEDGPPSKRRQHLMRGTFGFD